MQASLISKRSWLIVLFLLQLTPTFSKYYYDVVLVLFGLFIFFNNPVKFIFSQKPLIRILLLILIIMVLKYFFYSIEGSSPSVQEILGKIISDARIFYIIGLAYYFREIGKDSYSLFVALIFLVEFFNFITNILGLFSGDLYRQILSFYFEFYSVAGYYENFGKVTVSHVASLNNRYSGVFLQPVTAGLVHSTILFMGLISIVKIKFDWRVVIILCMAYFNGYVSQSTVFQMATIFLPLFLFFKIKRIDHKASLLISMLSVFIIIFSVYSDFFVKFIEINVMGLRFSEGSNNARYFKSVNLNWAEILFGHVNTATGKGGGDSGFIIKFINGGIIYMLFYYYFIAKYFKEILYWNNMKFISKAFFNALFVFLMLVETGTTSFSLPQYSLIIFFTLLLLSNSLNNKKSDRLLTPL